MNKKPLDRSNTFSTRRGGAGTDLEARPAFPTAPSEEVFEEEYQKIGWWKGPYAKPEARARVRDFWRLQGDRGLRWLAGRLRGEGHIDLLQGVASLLANAGSAGIPPILDELEHDPPLDQGVFLLKALGWMGEEGVEAQPTAATRLEAVLSTFLHHDNADLRESAVRAARLLPRERATGLLQGPLDAERDADVRQAIEEVIGTGSAGGA
jgi:hypothetical protein